MVGHGQSECANFLKTTQTRRLYPISEFEVLDAGTLCSQDKSQVLGRCLPQSRYPQDKTGGDSQGLVHRVSLDTDEDQALEL
jgi:hypothetical protein